MLKWKTWEIFQFILLMLVQYESNAENNLLMETLS